MSAIGRVRVAIIDRGVSGSAFGQRRLPQVRVHTRPDGKVFVREQIARDQIGHGTICAAILLSLAPDVQLWSVSVLGRQGNIELVDLAAAIQWCALTRIDIASISLGTPDDAGTSLGSICEFAQEHGVILIASSPVGGRHHFPAALPGVISVGAALLTDGTIGYHPSQVPEFTASGEPLFVADQKQGRTFGGGGGSSYAVPRVAGQVALLKQRMPHADLALIRVALASNAAKSEVLS